MSKKNERRKRKYAQLREAGFSSKEADALKDRSQVKVNELCRLNIEYMKQRNEIESERKERLKL